MLCHYAECSISYVTLSVIVQNDVIGGVVMMNVVAPNPNDYLTLVTH
jgi:hypothetical protein